MGGPAPDGADAFADWVRPHLPSMSRLAARLAPMSDRDDVVQDALLLAWSKRKQYDGTRGSAAGWLLAITANAARTTLRRRRVHQEFTDNTGVDPPNEDDMDIERALRRLTARQRLAVDCYYFVGLSTAETAAVMECSEGTVKSTLSDARARLRPLLEVSE